jgi:hypothetical protein
MATIKVKNAEGKWENVAIATQMKTEVESIELTGDCSYACAGPVASAYIEANGDTITTKDISNTTNMFYMSTLETIPFELNFTPKSTITISNMFYNCHYLQTLPKMNNYKVYNATGVFTNCSRLREIPEDYFDTCDWSAMTAATSAYNNTANGWYKNCHSLRKAPVKQFANMNPVATYSYSYLYDGFYYCSTLDELIDCPIPYTAAWTSNVLGSTITGCLRLKNFTFETNEDRTPKTVKWKSQTLDVTGVGVTPISRTSYITDYNSGITMDKRVANDEQYQALKNDPDWWTTDANYSRYNHDSAVATINSLPDTSAYLAEKGGTNTIKFKGAAGALTDGGAINTLTAEEIAVATAKGWTVTLS